MTIKNNTTTQQTHDNTSITTPIKNTQQTSTTHTRQANTTRQESRNETPQNKHNTQYMYKPLATKQHQQQNKADNHTTTTTNQNNTNKRYLSNTSEGTQHKHEHARLNT